MLTVLKNDEKRTVAGDSLKRWRQRCSANGADRLPSGFRRLDSDTRTVKAPRCSLAACRRRMGDEEVTAATMAMVVALWQGEMEKEGERETRACYLIERERKHRGGVSRLASRGRQW